MDARGRHPDTTPRLSVEAKPARGAHPNPALRLGISPQPVRGGGKVSTYRVVCATKSFVSMHHDFDLEPADARRIIEEQTARAARGLSYPSRILYLIWGCVFLLGFLPPALAFGPDPVVGIPRALALGLFFGAIGIGVALSIVVTARFARGLGGSSSRRGAMYGTAWALAFVGVTALTAQLERIAMDRDLLGVLVNGVAMLLVGALYMAGGAAWLDRTQFTVGAVISGVTTLALVVGFPAYYWIMCLGAGGVFLAAAAVSRRSTPAPIGTGAR